MSHIVIHEDQAGITQYRQFDELGAAVQFIEEQRNDGVETARLFELNEVHLAVRSYFKVEVANAAAPTAAVATGNPSTPTPLAAEPPAAPAEVERIEPARPQAAEVVAEPIDDISYVEAAMASPVDGFASGAPPFGDVAPAPAEPAPPAEVRRGLFGR